MHRFNVITHTDPVSLNELSAESIKMLSRQVGKSVLHYMDIVYETDAMTARRLIREIKEMMNKIVEAHG